MATKGRGQQLRGRGGECATLQALLASARSSDSQVLVLRGEPGVGKTALLEHMLTESAGFRVARVAGVESDIELAYAGLQQLCAPLMGYADGLPDPQRDALAVAFGRGVGPTPDRFLVGLAVLSLMAAATDEQPLLCLVDDAQWLDQVSVQTLGFVARRLLAEPVALVFAARDSGAVELAGLPELVIGGLSDSDARDLLDSVMLGGVDPRVRDRVVAETRGIPLALLQVPRNVPAVELAGGYWNIGTTPSAGQVEDGFVRRIHALPAATRRLLLVAAAEPLGDAALFIRAAAELDLPVGALAPAEAEGLIEFGSRMRFHHPLIRSAAYRAADPADRREVHRTLAAVTDAGTDPDRRAWHAARAASGPDDAVAAELEASAGRAQSRGGIAAAAAFLERAAVLTAEPTLRAGRAIAAARAKRDAAAPEAAYALLAMAELGPLTELQRAQVALLRAQMGFAHSRVGEIGAARIGTAATELLDAAKRLDTLDDELARETYVEALAAAMYAGRLGVPGGLADVAEAACVAANRVSEPHRPVDLFLRGMATRIVSGLADGRGALQAALQLWCSHAQRNSGESLHWLSLAFPIAQESAAGELWDDALTHRLAAVMVRYARDAGALALLPPALSFLAGDHILAGEFATATSLLEEADAISTATNYQPIKYHRVHLAAWRGVPEEALSLIDAAAQGVEGKGEGRLVGVLGYVAAVLYNGVGRYEEAFAAARQTCEYEDLGFYSWCLMELVEAATRIGEQDLAREAVRRLEERAGASGTNWGLGAVAAARALVADNEDAEACFVEAIERFEQTRIAVHLARTRLRYGEWLRRVNRRLEARRQLNTAHEMFTAMGASGFAERARREIAATGEKVRRQPVGSGDELTAQETQIARLAADGLTNQEIGAQLFISTHTVEWHLRKVFVKLAITSRRQLRTVAWAN